MGLTFEEIKEIAERCGLEIVPGVMSDEEIENMNKSFDAAFGKCGFCVNFQCLCETNFGRCLEHKNTTDYHNGVCDDYVMMEVEIETS